MTPSRDIREILARLDQRMVCVADAATLKAHIEHLEARVYKLTWREYIATPESKVVRFCLHCKFPEVHGHATWCPAYEEVDDDPM